MFVLALQNRNGKTQVELNELWDCQDYSLVEGMPVLYAEGSDSVLDIFEVGRAKHPIKNPEELLSNNVDNAEHDGPMVWLCRRQLLMFPTLICAKKEECVGEGETL